MKKIILSKSTFLRGIQCVKAIFMHYNNPELKTPFTNEQQMRFDQGLEVGTIGRNIYKGGVDLSQGGKIKGNDLIITTNNALQKKEQQIFYEPAFRSTNGELMFQADVFVRSKKKNRIIEIKSSTAIKLPEFIYDIGFQWKILIANGFDKNMEIYLAYLNKDYIRHGDLDIEKLFVLENVTSRAKKVQPLITRHLNQFKKILGKDTCPSIGIGEHCFKPYPCSFMQHCWKNIQENSVWNIGGIRKSKASKLFSSGIVKPEEIPRNTKLRETQWIEIDSAIENKPSVNRKELKNFLHSLNVDGPLLFMDFETEMPAIPKYSGTGPYEQLCFQYCILYQKNSDAEFERREFIAEPGHDPRGVFIKNLLNDTKDAGNIIVYNEVFEKSRLKELAVLFPEYAIEIEKRIERIRDLMYPFAQRHFYHPAFKGKHSIKSVLPVLCPELSYNNLEIRNGAMAMYKYKMLNQLPLKEQLNTKKHSENIVIPMF
jgi:hypothetical protein